MQTYIVKPTSAPEGIVVSLGTPDYARVPELGDVLRTHRDAAGLTRREVAEAIGETENKLYRWETGRNKPDVLAVLQLLVVYESSPEEIIEALAGPDASRAEIERGTRRLKDLAAKAAERRARRSPRGRGGKGG